jgi:hypothetical protein
MPVYYDVAYGEMMSVGPFLFGLSTAAYNALTVKHSWRWSKVDRLGVKPAMQFIGPGSGEMTFKGIVYPEFPGDGGPMVGPYQVAAMRSVAEQAAPMYVIDGRGNVYGKWVITEVTEDQSIFHVMGTPRKQEFTVTLAEYGGAASSGLGFNFGGGFDIASTLLSGFNVLGVSIEAGASRVLDMVGSDLFGDSPLGDLF